MPDDMPTKYCKRIQKDVYADTIEDSGRVFIICKYYNSGPCIFNPNKTKKCLVKLAVQREEKNRLSSQISS